ncbi:PREDICTED: auxin response factor 3-like isoform X2 [Ipomoea nil]|uniref:auxin response factor 3-like isoform X2 n=1 Tax=Ipomoea nil TaxID=35883 RepID=UPI00090086E7|nr:PREDICTED: auxin response factor 3-like isoform X2 [Ipomoea nil]
MMSGLIDLNTVSNGDGGDETSSSSANSELTASSGTAVASVCMELWHACAGPLISLPKKGSAVVYLPQGHLEHLCDYTAVANDLPPHVFCRVVDVKLQAELATDEVYAHVSLVPDNQIEQKWSNGETEVDNGEDDNEGIGKSTAPHMFCKTLTASDTSTHGGFSVPRRAAEDCFPPLDYKQQRPSQELVARDLHGIEWKFRHIYRGQPRRHLLTTGWSAFVNKKKLVSGDAVLFLRSGDGELRLGVRRADQAKSGTPYLAPLSQHMNISGIADVVNAISTKGVFHICYNPRHSSSEFIMPYHKFSRSLIHSFSAGMTFKMRHETEDAAERYTGLILGVSDVDPVRWPGSKWRSLLVRWDDLDSSRHNRVSPWEIEPSGALHGPSIMVVPAAKRTRVGLPNVKADFSIPGDRMAVSENGDPSRFQVLQGQEVLGLNTTYGGIDRFPPRIRYFPDSDDFRISGMSRGIIPQFADPFESHERTGFVESQRFNKVLQGQETFPNTLYGKGVTGPVQPTHGSGIVGGIQVQSHLSMRSTPPIHNCIAQRNPSTPIVQVSSPPSVLMFQQANSPAKFQPLYSHNLGKPDNGNPAAKYERQLPSYPPFEDGPRVEDLQRISSFSSLKEHKLLGFSHLLGSQTSVKGNQNLVSSMCNSNCRIFGFPLNEGRSGITKDNNPIQATTSLGHEITPFPCSEGQLHLRPPLITSVAGSNYTNVNDLYPARDALLDIAL